MPPVVTSSGRLRTTGVPLDSDLQLKVLEVKRLLGGASKAAAIRYMMLQGYERITKEEEKRKENEIRERLERERGAA